MLIIPGMLTLAWSRQYSRFKAGWQATLDLLESEPIIRPAVPCELGGLCAEPTGASRFHPGPTESIYFAATSHISDHGAV